MVRLVETEHERFVSTVVTQHVISPTSCVRQKLRRKLIPVLRVYVVMIWFISLPRVFLSALILLGFLFSLRPVRAQLLIVFSQFRR